MITTIIGRVEFKEDYLLLGTVLGVLKTDDGPLDLTLRPGISRISLVKGTLQIRYDSTIENQLDNLGVLGEVEAFNKQFPTVVKGYRDELFKFDDLPIDKSKLEWLENMYDLKAEFFAHIHKCHVENLKVEIVLVAPMIGYEIHSLPLKGHIVGVQNNIIQLKNSSVSNIMISLDNIVSLTYGG